MTRDREGLIRALVETRYVPNVKTATHVVDNIIEPTCDAAAMAEMGIDVTPAMVRTAGTGGYEVKCSGCGAKARLATKPPRGRGLLCPNCVRQGVVPK